MGRELSKVEYSQRIDGKWNKWQSWSAADWYDWEVEHLLEHMDYSKWILVDVVERKGQ